MFILFRFREGEIMSWLNFRSPLSPHPFIAALNSKKKLKRKQHYRFGIPQLDNLLAETPPCLSDFPYIYRRGNVDFDALLAGCPPLEALFRLPGAELGHAIVLGYITGLICEPLDKAHQNYFFRQNLYYRLFIATIMADKICLSPEDLKVFLLDIFPAIHMKLTTQVNIDQDSKIFRHIISHSLDPETSRMVHDILPDMAGRVKRNGYHFPDDGLSLIPPDST